MATLLYGKDSIDLEDVTTTIFSNEIKKMGFVSEVYAKAKGLVAHGKIKRKGFDRSHQDFECHYCYKR